MLRRHAETKPCGASWGAAQGREGVELVETGERMKSGAECGVNGSAYGRQTDKYT